MKKKILAVVLAVAILVILAVSAFAYTPGYPNKWVVINKDQSIAHTGTVAGTYKVFAGDNDACSSRALYFEAQCSEGTSFEMDQRILIGIGASLDNTNTTFKNHTVLWRLELNPYGVNTKNCVGTGYIWYDMQRVNY